MDKSTNEVRTLSWAAIIEQCQARPEGQSAKQWLKANGISEKQYYYWLRKLRKQAYEQSLSNNSPASFEKCMPEVAFAEIPSDGLFSSDPVTAVTKNQKADIGYILSSTCHIVSRNCKGGGKCCMKLMVFPSSLSSAGILISAKGSRGWRRWLRAVIR